MDTAGAIGSGSNSGFQALNAVIQFGATRIGLVGFDYRIDLGIHWHGSHQRLNNPSASSCEMWRRYLDGVANDIDAMGIEVVNCSPISALRNYRKSTLEDFLDADQDSRGRLLAGDGGARERALAH
jgi:hypothetical protein